MSPNEPKFSQEELENSKRIFKSATPKYTADWSIRGMEGLQFYDLVLSIIGIFGWLLVSFIWRDRALILLNSFGLLFLLRNLTQTLIG